MKKVLILGATGNLGYLTATALHHDPEVKLRVASSRDSGYAKLQASFPAAEVVIADWYDKDSLIEAMTDIDKIFVATPDFYTDENIVTPNIINAINAAGGIEQLVRLIAIPNGLTAEQLSPEFLATRCGANIHVIAKPLLDASNVPVTYINVPGWIMFNLPWFIAPEIKKSRKLTMPAVSDAARMFIAEGDISEVAAKLLREPAIEHIGNEYVLTSEKRYNYLEIAELVSEELGEPVEYNNDEGPLREMMGGHFDTLMTYFRHETQAYSKVVHRDTVATLLNRPQITLRDYIKVNRELFI